MPSPQSCGSCRWFDDPGPGAHWGGCDCPLPSSVIEAEHFSVNRELDGQSCPTWEQRAPDTETDR